MTLDALNALPRADAAEALGSCCGVTAWVAGMLTGRPYASLAEVLTRADSVWHELGPDAWRDAFAGHPRIGDGDTARHTPVSRAEQAAATPADEYTRAELARVNGEYEQRFGHIFLISAAGKSANEILDAARARLLNDPARELEVAAEEQRRITQRRLRLLLGAPEVAPA